MTGHRQVNKLKAKGGNTPFFILNTNLNLILMTTIESIQSNIHYTRKQLAKSRESLLVNPPKNALEKIQREALIEGHLDELKELRFCLKCAIKNESDKH